MAINWSLWTERIVGRGHPSLADTVNRPLREVLAASGLDPDASVTPALPNLGSVVQAHVQAGATAGQQIRAAVDALAATGGIVDCRGFPVAAAMVLDVDICGNLAVTNIKPYQFFWGAHEVRVKVRSIPRSHHHHTGFGTTFILKDENGARVTGSVFPFYTNSVDTTPSGGVVSTSGSAVVTMATPGDSNWAKLEVGSPVLVNGFVPPIGVDTTTINIGGGISSGDTSITVVSTTAFATASDQSWPQGGRIRIENEIISYTSKDATHFIGCTRGAEGTTAAAHANTTRVDRVSYQPFYVTALSGSSITLDGPMNITANNLAVQIGHLDISFDGVMTFDGNKDPTADDGNNPQGMWLNGSRGVYIGPGLTFKNWDHGGWTLTECQDSTVFGRGFDNGSFTVPTGSAFWIFGWNKRITADILEVERAATALAVDDRSILPQIVDGPAEDCWFMVRRATKLGVAGSSGNGLLMDGCRNCFGAVDRLQFIAALSGANGIHLGGASQWGDETTVACSGNVLEVGTGDSPDGTYLAVNVTAAANGVNSIMVKQYRQASNLQPKNVLWTADGIFGLTYGTTVNTRAERCEQLTLNVTNGVGFTIANPTSPTEGRTLTYYISNSSGGAMGAITWGAAFRLAGAFTNPANNQARMIQFRYHQSNSVWIEIARTAADQPI